MKHKESSQCTIQIGGEFQNNKKIFTLKNKSHDKTAKQDSLLEARGVEGGGGQ